MCECLNFLLVPFDKVHYGISLSLSRNISQAMYYGSSLRLVQSPPKPQPVHRGAWQVDWLAKA